MTEKREDEPRPPFEPEAGGRGRERPLGDIAQKLIRAGADALTATSEKIKERGEDFHPLDVISGAARVGVLAKEEFLTLTAKEIRSYLEKLKVGEELRALLTEHSLEVKASIRLKPLLEKGDLKAEDVDVHASLDPVKERHRGRKKGG